MERGIRVEVKCFLKRVCECGSPVGIMSTSPGSQSSYPPKAGGDCHLLEDFSMHPDAT